MSEQQPIRKMAAETRIIASTPDEQAVIDYIQELYVALDATEPGSVESSEISKKITRFVLSGGHTK